MSEASLEIFSGSPSEKGNVPLASFQTASLPKLKSLGGMMRKGRKELDLTPMCEERFNSDQH